MLTAVLDHDPALTHGRLGLTIIADEGYAYAELDRHLAERGATLLHASYRTASLPAEHPFKTDPSAFRVDRSTEQAQILALLRLPLESGPVDSDPHLIGRGIQQVHVAGDPLPRVSAAYLRPFENNVDVRDSLYQQPSDALVADAT